jgi:hypothetical protein
MALNTTAKPDTTKIRRLTKREIDRRIRSLIDEVSAPHEACRDMQDGPLRPRWIAPSELVRRMRRFIVYN